MSGTTGESEEATMSPSDQEINRSKHSSGLIDATSTDSANDDEVDTKEVSKGVERKGDDGGNGNGEEPGKLVNEIKAQAPEGLIRFDQEMKQRRGTSRRLVINLKEEDSLGASAHRKRTGSIRDIHGLSAKEVFEMNPRELAKMKDNHAEEVAELKAQLQAMEETLMQKDETTGSLRTDLKAKNAEIDLLKKEREHAKNLEEVRVQQLCELRQQLARSGEDFEQITEALAQRKDSTESQEAEIKELMSLVEVKSKENDRLKTKLRKRDVALKALHVEKHEVCLSARSFSENELIALRDASLQAKDKQIELINANCEKLETNLVQLEEEIERLHVDITRKDVEYSKLNSSCESQQDLISKLQRELDEVHGREDSIEITTKQNTHLLQLLQKQETIAEELQHKVKILEDENNDLKLKQRKLLRSSTEYELKASASEIEATKYRRQVKTMERDHDIEVESMSQTIGRLELNLNQQTEQLHEEMRTSRERYYKTLERLQSAESALRARTEAKLELEGDHAQILKRNAELENQLEELLRKSTDNDRSINSHLQALSREEDKAIRDLTTEKQKLSEENAKLTDEVRNLKQLSPALEKLCRAVKTALLQFEVTGDMDNMQTLKQLLYDAAPGILEDNGTFLEECGKDSVVDARIKRLGCAKRQRKVTNQIAVSSQAESMRPFEQLAAQRLRSYFEFLKQFMCRPARLIQKMEVVLPLSGCFGADEGELALQTLIAMIKVFQRQEDCSENKLVIVLQLQDNLLSDEVENNLLVFLSVCLPVVRRLHVDLRHNAISSFTIRQVALKLEAIENTTDVRIQREGLIQANHALSGKPFVVIDFREPLFPPEQKRMHKAYRRDKR